jgi:hypothetical protein
MFQSDELNSFLKSSHTVENEHAIFSEWNLNEPENIKLIGNYRYRPSDPESTYNTISPIFDPIDERNDYTGATSADIVLDGGFDDEDNPVFFTPKNKKMELIYSLEDCLKPFRPRSGINKILYLSSTTAPSGYNQYIDSLSKFVARRPRYYMSSKYDQFKYWTSYRTEVVSGEIPTNSEFGVSDSDVYGNYYISDAAPFVLYKNAVPANKVVIKMQTNVGEEDLGPFRIGSNTNVPDPMYGDNNRTVPKQWKIQGLRDGGWYDLIKFNPDSRRDDSTPIIGADGYVEIEYGLDIPAEFKENFVFSGILGSPDTLPDFAPIGYAYLIQEQERDRGSIYIYDGGSSIPEKLGWASFPANYSWSLVQTEDVNRSSKIVKKLVDPDFYVTNSGKVYREIDLLEGIRIVAEKMNVPNKTFDLIEISPRLVADISDLATSFSITKTMSDLGNSTVPVGGLFPSSGDMTLFDSDFAFNENNEFSVETGVGSIVANRRTSRIKFKFYEIIKNVNSYDYYVPIKTMYSEGIPTVSDNSVNISISLRDFYFYLESEKAPEMLLTDVSLSYAITVLLDNIGFSNYVFRRGDEEKDFVIPYFFVGAEQNVAQVLQDLAISTQSAMFFDEYNNFVVMSKEYILPENNTRDLDFTFYGHEEEWVISPSFAKISEDYVTIQTDVDHYLQAGDTVIVSGFDIDINGEFQIETATDVTVSYSVSGKTNATSTIAGRLRSKNLPNIVDIASQEKKVFNNGQINYTTRYIQRSIGKYSQAMFNAEAQNYIYKPVVLWEVAPDQSITSVNETVSNSGGYTLSAAPIKTSLTSEVPYVDGSTLTNNIIDFGENIYWLGTKYSGYFASNGEIIKYDAIEYAVQGVGSVWVSNAFEYQDYFAQLAFNGKMYPTGRVRIYTEPEYYTNDQGVLKLKSGPVKKHGRGQFGTKVVYHSAGLIEDAYWVDPNNVRGMIQDAKNYLFPMIDSIEYPSNLARGIAGKSKNTSLVQIDSDNYAKNSTRNGVIKNFLSNKNFTEKDASYFKTAKSGSVQTSALVFSGPEIPAQINQSDFVSYVYKDLSDSIPEQVEESTEVGVIGVNENVPYSHFGTRIRVLGKIETATNKTQTPIGAYEIFNSNAATSSNPSEVISFSGGSGGIGFGLNKETNNGYFYEIVALTSDQVKNFKANSEVAKFTIQKDPVVSVENDVMTIYTTTQHDLNVSDKIISSGLTDKDRPTNASTRLNGSHTVLSVSNDRKSLTAQITQPDILSASIVSAQGNNVSIRYRTVTKNFSAGQLVNISGCTNSAFNIEGAVIASINSDSIVSNISGAVKVVEPEQVNARYTTTAPHQFVVGQKVDIAGLSPEEYNIKGATVLEVGTNTFVVQHPNLEAIATEVGTIGRAFGIAESFVVTAEETGNSTGGTANYIPLTTTSESGGTITKPQNKDFNIYNVFFYKVLAGSNVAQIAKKQKDAKTGFVANQATLTSIKPHPFSVGDAITVSINDPQFDGSYVINDTAEYTFSYTTTNFDVIPLTDLEDFGTVVATEKTAIPQILWKGFAEINTDDGLFATEVRFSNSESTTTYDISAEYAQIDGGTRFFLFFNGKQIATVDDSDPLPIYNNLALFVRGSSRCMFENVFAIGKNYNDKLFYPEIAPIVRNGFDNYSFATTGDIVRKYGTSDIVKNAYYSGISAQEPPKYNMYFEEFGTIMREVDYFNVKYDRSYPALLAKIAPTINDIKMYNISGFYAGAYRAEFLIFNNMDKTINVDDTSGNALRIYGVSFTQDTTRSLRIDEYLDKVGNFSDPDIKNGVVLRNPFTYKEIYDKIKHSRLRYGNVEFSVDSPFIQSTSAAENILDWIIKKTYVPKRAVGIRVFGSPNLQLGDVCSINHRNSEGIYVLGSPQDRYVVYNIEYSKSGPDTSMTAYLVEV